MTESAVLSALLKLNPNKVPGPDCVPSWLLREYANLLARPITSVLNSILVQKILSLSIRRGVAQWVINFLTSRKQRVKLSSSCYSNWELMPAVVPQKTELGPWLFLLMINDLRIPGIPTWKYVDDTTIAEIVPRGKDSHVQHAVNYVAEWSSCNLIQLNAAKCKELVNDYKKFKLHFESLVVSDKNLTVVQNWV